MTQDPSLPDTATALGHQPAVPAKALHHADGEIVQHVRCERWFGDARVLGFAPNGDSFLVAGALPGEVVDVEMVQREYSRLGRVVSVRESSAHRISPICPVSETCTGCALLHADESAELDYRRRTMREVFSRVAGLDLDEQAIVSVGNPRRGGHRKRARFSVELPTPSSEFALGFRGFRRELVQSECAANEPAINVLARHVEFLARKIFNENPSFLAEFSAEHSSKFGVSVEIVSGQSELGLVLENWPALVSDALARRLAVNSIIAEPFRLAGIAVRRAKDFHWIYGKPPTPTPIAGIFPEPSADGWTQPHPDNATALYRALLELGIHRGARILDATCGNGTLSVLLAGEAASVLGVDAHWPSVCAAKALAANRGLYNAEFRGGKIQTVAASLAREQHAFDLVVLNPMRSSVGDECMQTLASLTSNYLLYLAPAPLAAAHDFAAIADQIRSVEWTAVAHYHPGTARTLGALLVRIGSANSENQAEV